MSGVMSRGATSNGEEEGFDAGSPAYVLVRWLQFIGLLIVIGATVFHYGVLGFLRRREDPDSPMLPVARRRAAQLARGAVFGLGVVAIVRLYAQSYAMHGSTRGAVDLTLLGAMITRTVWGEGWLIQIIGVIVAAIGFSMVRSDAHEQGTPRSRLGWGVAAIGVVALAFTPAFSGHAASTLEWRTLAILADGVHVLGAGGWLGSLLFVLGVGIPAALHLPEAERGPMVAELVNAFSPVALVCAGLTATTGVFAAWLHLGVIPALWGTHYGRILLIKLTVLSIVAGTGAYNWLTVKPRLGDTAAVPHLRRSATAELMVGAVVLLITAVLVATPME
jgi:putative copper export protein